MANTISSALRDNRTLEERIRMLTDTDGFKELVRQYAKYNKFFYYESNLS